MHTRRDLWQPILEGELRERAEEHLQAILRDLHPLSDSRDASLASGHAGLSLLFGYLAEARSEASAAIRAREHLDAAARALAEVVLPPGLYSGFTGIAWSHTQLERDLYGTPEGDAAEDVDEAILNHVRQVPWPYHYDLVTGLVGFAVYALERLPRRRARETLQCILARLQEVSSSSSDGIYWHTPARLLPPRTRAQNPNGCCNLGIAHGVPGVIAVLAAIVAHGAAEESARAWLDGALAWLWTQRLPADKPGWFAADDGPTRSEPARLAWCYGDAGIAATLWAASRVLEHRRLRELAFRIGLNAARRDRDTAGVIDAGLCHGAAGLGHCFNRMFQTSGEEIFLDAARAWFLRALELRREGWRHGGYPAWAFNPSENAFEWQTDPGLLTGAAGVAAALLAATSRVPPEWDRFLLLSFPGPATAGQSVVLDAASGRGEKA